MNDLLTKILIPKFVLEQITQKEYDTLQKILNKEYDIHGTKFTGFRSFRRKLYVTPMDDYIFAEFFKLLERAEEERRKLNLQRENEELKKELEIIKEAVKIITK